MYDSVMVSPEHPLLVYEYDGFRFELCHPPCYMSDLSAENIILIRSTMC